MAGDKSYLSTGTDGGAGMLFVVALAPVRIWVAGYTVMKLWLWFIVPAFGLPALTLANAIGLDILVSFLTLQMPMRKCGEPYKNSFVQLVGIVTSLFMLFSGWIIFTFFMH